MVELFTLFDVTQVDFRTTDNDTNQCFVVGAHAGHRIM